MPREPRKFKVEAVNSTSVHLEWKAPANKEKNGIIRGYQVHYIKVNDREEPIGSPFIFNVPDMSILFEPGSKFTEQVMNWKGIYTQYKIHSFL